MKRHSLFSKHQYGFISGRSTILQLLVTLDKWTEILDNGGAVETIYLDFRKAFDTVPHKRLLVKLRYCGIVPPLLGWIEDFITNRKQRVVINDKCSQWGNVTSGIPQGSVLGPILFVIYINDMPKNFRTYSPLFADDTKLFEQITLNDTQNAITLQEDINQAQKWSNEWLMPFNYDKCNNLEIGNVPENINFYMTVTDDNGQDNIKALKKVSEEKDLGIYMDKGLNFKKHIDVITRKST